MFDKLPVELKEQILFYTAQTEDITTLAGVSKDWRNIIRSSRRILQKKLNDYHFFFVVHILEKEKSYVFPISTEKEFNFFSKHKTNHSQIAAVKGLHDHSFFYGAKSVFFFPYEDQNNKNLLVDTKRLILGIKTNGEKFMTQTFCSCTKCLNAAPRWPWPCKPLADPKKLKSPRFSNKATMLKLLKEEHYAARFTSYKPIRGLPVRNVRNNVNRYYLYSKNSDQIISVSDEYIRETTKLRLLHRNDKNCSYCVDIEMHNLPQSLFLPLWMTPLSVERNYLSYVWDCGRGHIVAEVLSRDIYNDCLEDHLGRNNEFEKFLQSENCSSLS